MFLVSLHFLCAAHNLHCLAGYFFFPSPPPTVFSSLYILKSPESLPGGSCLGPLLAIEGQQNLTHFNSGLPISRTLLTYARSSCTLLCLYLASCTQKICWRAHTLVDTVPPFLNILQFSSELSNKWGTGLPCLRPVWIYCTGQKHKASLFPCLFPCLSSLCLQLLHPGSYLSFARLFFPHLQRYITIPLECWLIFFWVLAFLF